MALEQISSAKVLQLSSSVGSVHAVLVAGSLGLLTPSGGVHGNVLAVLLWVQVILEVQESEDLVLFGFKKDCWHCQLKKF